MSRPHAIERPAWAKINLALSVGPPVPEGEPGAGYHPIASWMACVDFADEIRVERLPSGSDSEHRVAWRNGHPVPWPIEDDLAVRAHRALEEEAGRPLPVRLDVAKRIPAGSGLGGGSSDAASTLVALAQLFQLEVPASVLRGLGHALGSDVPFFIDEYTAPDEPPRPALVGGLGECIERTERVSGSVILIIPPFPCPTPAVYRAFDELAGSPQLLDAEVTLLAEHATLEPGSLFNELVEAAEHAEPRLAELRERVSRALRVPALVSGSGSTLFVIGDGAAAAQLRGVVPECRVTVARII